MLARILKLTFLLLLLATGALFSGCVTEKKVALVDDPDTKRESQIPWNKQEKWETEGQYAGMTDRR